MQATTLQIKKATYTNGLYYVHGWKSNSVFDSCYRVAVGKRGQYRRSGGKTISVTLCNTYEEAVKRFSAARLEIDQIVSDTATKRSTKSDARKAAIAAFKAATPNPWNNE
jgi:hypothetical protein